MYEAGIRSATIPHTHWVATGQIQKAFPDLFIKNTILRNVSEQMLAYALGRPVEDCDEPAVLAIQSSLIKGDKKFSSLVLAVVKSFPFQHRRSDR